MNQKVHVALQFQLPRPGRPTETGGLLNIRQSRTLCMR